MTNRIEMTRPLFDHLSDVASSVAGASHVFLLFDFDGTLAPIVEEPSMASMPPETRQSLVSLAQRRRFSLAIVSGRSLSDLQRRVGLEGLTYAGNHGLAICGPGIDFVEPTAAGLKEMLQEISQDLRKRLCHISGAEIENKGLTASVHFRRAPEESLERVREIVGDVVTSVGHLFHVTQGLQSLEIRPQVDWNKGTAACWIVGTSERPHSLPVYLGDDATDEDAFSALSAGITVRVGRAAATSAQYHLEYQEAVPEFLIWLAEFDDSLAARGRQLE
jgi:trehalose 6-phosphate phosphatase